MEKSLEDLVETYQKSGCDKLFNIIYKMSYPQTLRFLLSKKVPYDDAEDLLSKYYSNDFHVALKRYKRFRGNNRRSKPFIRYVFNILHFRAISYYKQKATLLFLEKETLENLEAYDNDPVFEKDFITAFKESLFSIRKEKHRDSVILRFSLPSHVRSNELAKLLNISLRTFNTWLYRGMKELYQLILNNEYFNELAYEEALSYINRKDFKAPLAFIEKVDETGLLVDWLFYNQNISLLASKHDISEEDAFELIQSHFLSLKEKLSNKSIYLSWASEDKVYSKAS